MRQLGGQLEFARQGRAGRHLTQMDEPTEGRFELAMERFAWLGLEYAGNRPRVYAGGRHVCRHT
jgi:hypothetical protein